MQRRTTGRKPKKSGSEHALKNKAGFNRGYKPFEYAPLQRH